MKSKRLWLSGVSILITQPSIGESSNILPYWNIRLVEERGLSPLRGGWTRHVLTSKVSGNITTEKLISKAIGHNGLPEKVVFDKSGANALALHNINVQLWLTGRMLNLIEVLQVKYLNNLVEQSHRKVKGKMHQCLGWKSDEGAKATLAGIELWSMIKNRQFDNPDGLSVWDEFYALAA